MVLRLCAGLAVLSLLAAPARAKLSAADEKRYAELWDKGDEASKAGRCEEAEARYREALGMAESFGLRNGQLPGALITVGGVLHAKGDFAQAKKLYLRALKLLGKEADEDIYYSLGAVESELKEYGPAFKHMRQAQELSRKNSPKDKKGLAGIRLVLGDLYENTGRFAEAEQEYKAALKLLSPGSDDTTRSVALSNVATFYWNRSRMDLAERYFQDSIKLGETAFGESHPAFVGILELYAGFLDETSRGEEAAKLRSSIAGLKSKQAVEGRDCPGRSSFQFR